MADVRPIRALRYEPGVAGPLADVTAPPYDVIDSAERAELLRRSPFNVVELDLPRAPEGGDPYRHAAETLEAWLLQGVLTAEREPSVWALEQHYAAPDGTQRTRRGFLAAVRVTDYGPGRVRPHERTQPGPKEDRLRLTRATRHNLSPIFALYDADAWPAISDALDEPFGEVTDGDGTVHRLWRVGDPSVHERVVAELRDAELLIADGHHRYETARTYAEEIGGEGPHRYTLACLVSLDDPGLTVFPTHRLLTGLGDDPAALRHLSESIHERFEVTEVGEAELEPGAAEGIGVFGYVDAELGRPLRLRLRDPSILDAALAGRSEAYRRLDAAILERAILADVLGLSEDDIAAKRGIAYAKSRDEVTRALREGRGQAAFLLRPTPISQVREVAAAGETMPPKSTYFFPKLLTGLVFNPLG